MAESSQRDEPELVLLLERVGNRPIANDEDVIPAGPTREAQMALLEELHRRGWVRIGRPLHGDGRLMSARDISITRAGETALEAADAPKDQVESNARPVGRTTEEKRKLRGEFMTSLYRRVDGDTSLMVNPIDLGGELGWDPATTRSVVQHLRGNGLVVLKRNGNLLSITHSGVVEVEELESSPTRATEHFAPLVLIHGDNYGPIQAGGSNNRQQVISFHEAVIRDFLRELKSVVDDGALEPAVGQLVATNSAIIETELAARGPDSPVVRKLLPPLRDVGLGVVASGAYEALRQSIEALSGLI